MTEEERFRHEDHFTAEEKKRTKRKISACLYLLLFVSVYFAYPFLSNTWDRNKKEIDIFFEEFGKEFETQATNRTASNPNNQTVNEVIGNVTGVMNEFINIMPSIVRLFVLIIPMILIIIMVSFFSQIFNGIVYSRRL